MLINVNGQSYARWEDVPADVRQQLAATLPDADRNGIPDLFEGNLNGLPTGGQSTFTSISVDGQTVGSVGELPPEAQEALRQAFGWPAAGTSPAAPAAAAAAAAAGAVPPSQPSPLQPGQVMLNGVPTPVADTTPARKPWWKRLFGG
jgi:hypothetical protein